MEMQNSYGSEINLGNRKIYLKGQEFGNWTVLEDLPDGRCLCRCSCGKEREVLARSLRTGKSTSCGHKNIDDLTKYPAGTFGEWTPISYAGSGEWECQCSCGNKKRVKTAHLVSGASKSCGHNTTRFKDLSGSMVGDWKVLKYLGNSRYECLCTSCNTTKEVEETSLRNKTSTNCGCSRGENLIGKEFWMLKVVGWEKETSRWICKCSCGSDKAVKVGTYSLTNGLNRSCGCNANTYKTQTMLERYGETTASRINNPRSIEIINACNNREAMIELIQHCENMTGQKPTVYTLMQYMGMTNTHVLEKIRKFGLEDIVKIGVYGQMEESIAQLIESWGVEVERHNRSILEGSHELDIYIPSRKIAIEFNGTHWHSEEFKKKTYHQNKSIQCFRAGIHLIHIFEHEWLDAIKRRKIMELLKREIVPSSNTIIHARKTKLVRLENREIARFIDDNHLQGHVTSGINYGLTYNDELVAVMTFGKPRFTRDDTEYELIRLAYKAGVVIPGGSSRLFKAFLRDYKPNSIISYCDIAKFSGKVYGNLGFMMGTPPVTDPNYVWISKDQKDIRPRYKTMKHKLVEMGWGTPDMTENSIMIDHGYSKVYDCGNYKFIWRPN